MGQLLVVWFLWPLWSIDSKDTADPLRSITDQEIARHLILVMIRTKHIIASL